MDGPMKVGELARRSGLTVRTLHHYDEIGLLHPSGRTPSGHRVYGVEEVKKLQQIASLRHIGLPLEEIRECLARPEYSLEYVLGLHAERLREQIQRQERLHALLERVREQIQAPETVGLDALLTTIEMTVMFEKYYSAEQLTWLEERAASVGEDRIVAAQQEWTELYADFEEAMNAGLDPALPAVQALVQRSAALVADFTGGNAEVAASLGRMFEEEGGEKLLRQQGMGLPDGLWEYMERARLATTAEPD